MAGVPIAGYLQIRLPLIRLGARVKKGTLDRGLGASHLPSPRIRLANRNGAVDSSTWVLVAVGGNIWDIPGALENRLGCHSGVFIWCTGEDRSRERSE
jgi:hypothetical protein